jgi:hypothetical protein
MNSIKKYLALMLLIGNFMIPDLHAQDDLEIKKVFDQYGEKKGVIMVELTSEILEDFDFTLFKSITIKNNPPAADFIRKCLSKDEIGAKKVKQVVSNGIPTTIYLQLPRKGDEFRLILFNETLKPELKNTLIYIESKKDTEEALKLIIKKK